MVKRYIFVLFLFISCFSGELNAQSFTCKLTAPEGKVLDTDAQKDITFGSVESVFFIKKADGSKVFFPVKNPRIELNDTPDDIIYLQLKNLRWTHESISSDVPFKLNPDKIETSEPKYLELLDDEIEKNSWLKVGEPSVIDIPFQIIDPKHPPLNVKVTISYIFKNKNFEIFFVPQIRGRTKDVPVIKDEEPTVEDKLIVKESPVTEDTINTEDTTSTEELLGGPVEVRPQVEKKDTVYGTIVLKDENTVLPDLEIDSIAIDEIWDVLDKRKIKPLREFVKEYKKDEYAVRKGYIGEAKKYMIAAEERAWVIATTNNSYKSYKRLFPKGKYAKEAKAADSSKEKKTDDEDVLWESISDSENAEDYEEYMNLYPEGKYVEEAEEAKKAYAIVGYKISKLPFKENIQIYDILLENVTVPRLLTRPRPDQLEFDDDKLTEEHILRVFVKDVGKYKVVIKDLSGKIEIILDNSLKVSVDSVDNNFVFKVEGGMQPYKIELLREGASFAKQQEVFGPDDFINELINDTITLTLPIASLAERGLNGVYKKIQFSDNTGREGIILEKYRLTNQPIYIVQEQSNQSTVLLGAGAGLILLLFIVYLLKDNKKHKKIEKDFKQYKEKQQEKKKFNDTDDKYPKQINISKRTARSPSDVKIRESSTTPRKKKKTKITITKRQSINGILDSTVFDQMVKKQKFKSVTLAQHWKDSTVKQVFIHENCIMNLSQFLQEENLDRIMEEKEGAIPEIGGFLMGVYAKINKQEQYKVTLNKFIPFVPEYHDLYKIEIGTETLVKELGDAQDKYPELAVIGWFHTHPGHGLFLSMPDLAVQKHFSKKYQLAMEIDSLTSNLDTAFFTQKEKGKMNNSSDRIAKQWFSWKTIKKGMI